MATLSYREAGVDIDAGDELVERIKPLAAKTRIPEVLADVGGFAGLCRIPDGMKEPVLVSGTDGVGTKLKVAFAMKNQDTVGIDVVAMCVNDIVTTGARPLFFLDYIASGSLDVDVAESVIKGVAEGCQMAGCALLGGETAELPGFYPEGEYELVGFAVGVVERSKMLGPDRVRSGDVLLGVASSGIHSNGYSLARKVLLERGGLALGDQAPALGESLGACLLRPTRIYARTVAAAIAAGPVSALCHVTGGGIDGNLPRVLPPGTEAVVDETTWPAPPIFRLIAEMGPVEATEMQRTFNMGLGLVVVVRADAAEAVASAMRGAGEAVYRIGAVRKGQDPRVVYKRP
jgi:phosphoribosylformylglycinamidine cyclo-ligase